MKVICEKNKLLEAINTVQKAVSLKSSMSILEGILLETIDNTLKLTGTNLEISIEYLVDAEISKKGKFILNSRTFGEIIRKLPNAPVTIELIDNLENTDEKSRGTIIKSGNSKFKINNSSSDGYPENMNIKSIFNYEINQAKLKDMIRQTVFAISNDEKNKVLNGSLFEFNKNIFSIVSIDGFRMAIRLDHTENNSEEYKMIIPGKTLSEVHKIFTNNDKNVIISSSGKQVLFQTENCRFFSKIIGGDYLNYYNFLPKDIETVLKLRTTDLLSSVERAAIIASEEKKFPVKFKISDDRLTISSHTDIGEVKDELFPDIEGNDVEISFNPRYYLEALKNIEDEEILIQFTTNIGPSIIKPIEGNKYIYMILPVRT
ncbi:MAG: DNA polymerase III subunit beta [Clostridiales bacterium]